MPRGDIRSDIRSDIRGDTGPTLSAGAVTGLLMEWRRGDEEALAQLLPIVYDELRLIAARHLRRERDDLTLQPTAVVHEAFLKLVDLAQLQWQDRAHFLAVASRLMRQVLLDHARGRLAAKRGGGVTVLELVDGDAAVEPRRLDLVALDAALERLAALDSQQASLVELRFFGGLTMQETAEVLGCSTSTAKRDWDTARIWLFRELGG
jgi:RNA polymerase sigma factor (TIGR02999 family)